MKSRTITCPTCHGEGNVPSDTALAPALAKTLAVFRKGRKMDVEQVRGALRMDSTPNAVSNRLVKLSRLGLLARVRKGRQFVYTLNI